MELEFPSGWKFPWWGHQIEPLALSPSFNSILPCKVKHFIYRRHHSLHVCKTFLNLILLRFLPWAQKVPPLGFGCQSLRGADLQGTLLPLAQYGVSFSIWIYSCCMILGILASFSMDFQDVLWNGNVAVWERLTARVLNLSFTKDNLFNIKYEKLCLRVALEPLGCRIDVHAGTQVHTTCLVCNRLSNYCL